MPADQNPNLIPFFPCTISAIQIFPDPAHLIDADPNQTNFKHLRLWRFVFFCVSLPLSFSLSLSIYPTIGDKLILESVIYWGVSLSSTHGWFSIPICHLPTGDDSGKHRQSNYSKGFSPGGKLFSPKLKIWFETDCISRFFRSQFFCELRLKRVYLLCRIRILASFYKKVLIFLHIIKNII